MKLLSHRSSPWLSSNILPIFFLLLICSGCQSVKGGFTSTVTPIISSITTFQFTPTSTPISTIISSKFPFREPPVSLGIPVPHPIEKITPQNAGRIVPLAVWGMGIPEKVRYSPSGEILAVATSIGIWIYDAGTYTEGMFFPTDSPATDIAFSNDGKFIVAAAAEAVLRIDVETRSAREIITPGGQEIALSPDGEVLALYIKPFAYCAGIRVLLYDMATSTLLDTQTVGLCITDLAFSPDNRFLVASTTFGITIWDRNHGMATHSIPLGGMKESPYALAFSPNGDILGVATYVDTYLYDTATWEILRKLTPDFKKYGMPSYDLSFSPAGDRIASVSDAVYIWDTASGSPVSNFSGNYVQYTGISWSADGRKIATLSDFPQQGEWPEVAVWDVAAGQTVNRIGGFTNGVDGMDWMPDGNSIVAAYANGAIRRIALATGQSLMDLSYPPHLLSIAHKQSFSYLAVSPDGMEMMADLYFSGGAIVVHFGPPPSIDPTVLFPSEQVIHSVYSPRGSYLAFSLFDAVPWTGSVEILNRRDLSLHINWQLPKKSPAVDLAFSSDEKYLFFAQADTSGRFSEVVALDLADGTIRKMFGPPSEGRRFNAFAISPSGNSIALADMDGFIHISDFSNDSIRTECLGTAAGGGLFRSPYSISWSPDESLLAYGSPTGTLCLIDTKTGTVVESLHAHSDFIDFVRFSPDGRLIATASIDGTVRLWGVKNM